MIGVLAKDTETGLVTEFFQLFKTAWEFWNPQHDYGMLIVTSVDVPVNAAARLVLIYNSERTSFDRRQPALRRPNSSGQWLQGSGTEFPVYGKVARFETDEKPLLYEMGAPQQTVAGFATGGQERRVMRFGYDLFGELSFLLTEGQPPEHAPIPTLEIQIALIRRCMVMAGIPFVEIPSAPYGYRFAASLTHDVDFVGIRQHKFDRTLVGFLLRASAGSLCKGFRGSLAWRKVVREAFRWPWKPILAGCIPE